VRAPADMPPVRRSPLAGRGRIALIVLAGLLVVLVASARGLAGFYTDWLWFDSVGRRDVWTGLLTSQLVLAAMFTLVFAVILWVSLAVTDRFAPAWRPGGPEDELLRRYQDMMSRRAGLARTVVSVAAGLLAGLSMASQWESWLLFLNGSPVGITDPQFGMDVSFYLFRLPFISLVIDWLFASLVVILFITAIAYYLNGGIRLQTPGERVTPQVKAHLSLLLGLMAIVRAADYWYDRYELVYSDRSAVTGALYTAVNAELPVLNLLLIIALLSAVLFIVNIRRRGWVLPVVAVGLWAFVAVTAGVAYPAFIQRFQVTPDLSQKEAPFVARNIEATRYAMGMSEVETRRYSGFTSDIEAGRTAVQTNSATIRNVPLLDATAVLRTFQRLQPGLGFYRFLGLENDRYEVRDPSGNVTLTQSLVSTRELAINEVPDTWENRHIVYTHGYGMALAPANVTTSNGQPDFLVRDLPVEVSPSLVGTELNRPELYVAEDFEGFAIVGTTRNELAFLDEDGGTEEFRYDGREGVNIGSFTRRAAFALRFADWNVMVSDFITDESRVIFRRDVRQRVQDVAPFLSLDSEIYPVIADGRIYYMVDAYTTSTRWPYAQQANTDGLSRSGLQRGFNYVRNSVKAVVDAYDGTVTLYVMDDQDPIARAWRSAFPNLFSDGDEMSEGIRAHIRYPRDLFTVQTSMYARYHLDEPREFLEQTNAWQVAPAPPRSLERQIVQTTLPPGQGAGNVAQLAPSPTDERMRPYYQILRLPGDDDQTFVQMRAFTPRSTQDTSQKLTAFMAAKSDPDSDFGKLVVFEMPANLQVPGPKLVTSQILADDVIAQQLNLLDSRGSTVTFGDLMLLPMTATPDVSTILYVWPVYVASSQTNVPELRNVVGVFGERVVMLPTLREVIQELFGVDLTTFEGVVVDGDTDGPTDPDAETEVEVDDGVATTTSTTIAQAAASDPAVAAEVAAIAALLDQADRALLDRGDLAEYQRLVREANERLRALQTRIGSSP
jgi:uncharacterized protein